MSSKATHIRAGEVIAKRISGLTYQFTFIGYRDEEGVPFGQGVFDFGDGNFFGDDVNEEIPWGNIVHIGNGVEKWEFTLTYTYAGASSYLVSYKEDFRNSDIQNISGSISTSFYVETLIIIDPLIINNTPYFTVPPIDQGVVGAIFEHNPGAFDPDGDSLSYYFIIPKQDKSLNVNGHQSPIASAFYDNFAEGNQEKNGLPTLTINPITGTIVWDAPGGATIPDEDNREFNISFVVEEWRRINGVLIRLGFVSRDMQIIIWDFENEPPELEIPEDVCTVVGEQVTGDIIGSDPNGDQVKIEAFGGPFQIKPIATVTPNPAIFEPPPSLLSFEWEPNCGHVRTSPYEVQFKISDDPNIPEVPNPPSLVNFETWQITVVGPPPTGLTVNRQPGRQMQLNWDEYACTNADSIQIWRRVGAFDVEPDCNSEVIKNAGYERIETVSISKTSFLDTNDNLGLAAGSKYCYRLMATFPLPAGGKSVISEEACDSLLIDVPVITNVDVKTTSETTGQIEVRWTPPYEIDTLIFPPPYTYEVLRKEELDFQETFMSIRPPSIDTTFLDTDLNTKNVSYSYKIVLYDNTRQPIDTSQQASLLRLEITPLVGAIRLNWKANVPWSNKIKRFPYHYIWRDNIDEENLSTIQIIDSVDVTTKGLTYLDNGKFNGVVLDEEVNYCYYITSFGSYDNSLLPEPLLNNSQINCGQPNDTIPPCMPVSITFSALNSCEQQLENIPCGVDNQFYNELIWEQDGDISCDNDIQFYHIYFSKSGLSGTYTLLDKTIKTRYTDSGLSSLEGCYIITAVDRSRNESQFAEPICNDNCQRYVLPNVITPNGDGKNDVFRPLKDTDNCPRFVKSVQFKVFNRTGTLLFEYDSKEPEKTILINWDGTTKRGEELPAGIYFYSAEVQYIKLNPQESQELIKGWVQIIR